MKSNYQVEFAKELFRLGSYEKLAKEREKQIARALKSGRQKKEKNAA